MSSNLFDNIYGALFTPDKTFNELKENPVIEQGFIIVVCISMLATLLNFSLIDGFNSVLMLGINVIFSAFAGVISWVFFASFFELIAGIFKQAGKIRIFLTLSAFSLLPWAFLAPIQLFKTGGKLGGIFGIIFGLAIWLWSTALIVVSVIKSYNLSLGRALVFLIVPFVGGILSFNWFIGFFSTLSDVLKM